MKQLFQVDTAKGMLAEEIEQAISEYLGNDNLRNFVSDVKEFKEIV